MKKRWIEFLLPQIFLHLILVLILNNNAFTQSPLITVEKSIDQYVKDDLIGKGLKVSEISFKGDPIAISSFSNGDKTNIGIDKGVLITTGVAYDTLEAGPHGPNSRSNATHNNSGESNPFLEKILGPGVTTEDAATLEFKFVPSGDTIRMKYVFASEEFPEFVCSNYNDIFGFFITGPDPFGGEYLDSNFAKVPGQDLPVAINSVNNGTEGQHSGGKKFCYDGAGLVNAHYFIDNCNGCNDAKTTIQYDGFSVPMEIIVPVECGMEYTFKIMIADVSDYQFDSGVFLEAHSLSGNISNPIIAAEGTTICAGQSTILKAIAPGGPYYWFKDPIGGDPIFIGDNLTTPILFKDTVFYVERTDKGCVSQRIPVHVIVNEGPELNIQDQVSCGLLIDLTKGVFTSETNISYHTSLTDAQKNINPILDPSSVPDGTYYVRVESSSSCVTIKAINAKVVSEPDLTTTDLVDCEPSSSLNLPQGVSTNGNSVNFYQNILDAQIDINRYPTPNNAAPGKYYVRSELPGGCFSLDSLNATINKIPTISTMDQYVCSPELKIDLTKGYTSNGESVTFHPTINDAYSKINAIHNPDKVDPGTYYVRSEFSTTGCYVAAKIEATIEPEPEVIITDLAACSPAISFDLTTGVSTNNNNVIEFYKSITDANNGINALANPKNVVPQNYFVKIISPKGCSIIKPLKAEEKNVPTLTTSNIENCEPHNEFDLNLGITTNGSLIMFFSSLNNAINNINPISDPQKVPSGKFYVRSESATDCYSIDSLETIELPSPNLVLSDIEKCEPDNSFDLNNAITQNNAISTSFYSSHSDAINELNKINNPTDVPYGLFFVKSKSNKGCSIIDSLEAIQNPKPDLSTNNLVICYPNSSIDLDQGVITNSQSTSYFLSLENAQNNTSPISNSNTAPVGKYFVTTASNKGCIAVDSIIVQNANSELTVVNQEVCSPINSLDLTKGVSGNGLISYHLNNSDAVLGINPINQPSKVGEGTYYVRNNSGGCVNIKPINATINPSPVLNLEDQWICEPHLVDLTLGTGGFPFELTYFYNSEDALKNENSIPNPTAVNKGLYFVRGEFNETGCFSIDSIKASIFPVPELTTEDQHTCYPEKVNLVFGLYTNGNATFHYSKDDADKGTNPIPDPTSVDNGLYHVRSASDLGCVKTDSIRAFIDPAPQAEIEDQRACSPMLVNLTNGVSSSDNNLTVQFFESLKDATDQLNPLTNPKVVPRGKYYVRLESIYGCNSIKEINAFIDPAPNPPSIDDELICRNSKAYLTIDNPIGEYNWYASPNGTNILSTSSTFATPNLANNAIYYVEMVDIETKCPSSRAEVKVNVTDTLPGPELLAPVICEGDSGSIFAIGPNGPYNWYTEPNESIPFYVGNQLKLIYPNKNKVYYVEISGNASCPGHRTAISPNVVEPPLANFNIANDNINPSKIVLADLTIGGTTGTWSFDDGLEVEYDPNIKTITHQFNVPKDQINNFAVTLIVSNQHNCTDTITKSIKINSFWDISFPNAFTPNGDNLNDTFFGKGYGIEDFQLTIFNRWGEVIFYSTNINEHWDGRSRKGSNSILPSGLYVWKARIKDVYNEKHVLSGHILLQK